jgi:transposase-like protein
MKRQLKPVRIFSEEVKKEVVGRIERSELRVSEAAREYSVVPWTVYKWLHKYSRHLKRGEVLVVQKDSEQQRNVELRSKIAELERIIGQKQMEIDFLNKVIEIGSQEVQVDIKKKFGGKQSIGSEAGPGNTLGK